MATPRKRKPLSLPALPEPGVEARLHAACVKAGAAAAMHPNACNACW